MSLTFSSLSDNGSKIRIDNVHDGLVELEELSKTVGVLPPREGKTLAGQWVVPGEIEVAQSILLLHFIGIMLSR